MLTPLGRDAAIASAMLSEAGIESSSVATMPELVQVLSDGASMVVITEDALRDADLHGLSGWLEAQPEWSDLPFILLTAQGGSIERNPAAARYLHILGNVTFLERPFHPTTFVSLAKAALRARNRQYDARSRLETIRVGEQRLRVALAAGRLGAWTVNLDDRALFTSPQCKAHYGRAEDAEFSFADLMQCIHSDDLDNVRAAMQAALDGPNDYDVEYRCIWPDGQVHWIQARGRIDSTVAGKPVSMTGVTLLITARKTEQTALQLSEARFRAAVAAVQGVVWTNSASGEMLGEQPGWASLTGQTRAEYEGYGWAKAVHPDDADATVAAWNESVAERKPFEFEHRIRLKSGEWGIFAVRAVPAFERNGTIREWVGVHTDITRQRVAERELAELAASLEERVAHATASLLASQTRLRSLFESSFQYAGELRPDGIMLDANATALAGIEAEREAAIGKPFWDTPWFSATPGAPEAVREAVERAAAGEPCRLELTLDLPIGRRIFDFSLRPVRASDGQIVALLPEAIDITDRREAEARLLQSQKLETIGQLTGGVAHDFNNLLTPIVGSLELLRRRLDGDERAHKLAAAGLESAERARILVNRLLTFARQQELETAPVDVAALVEGMRDLIVRSIGPTIKVEVQSANDLPPALVDPNQLELSMLNLCVNARDAMPDGGSLAIAIDLDDQASPFVGATEPHYLRIAVTDTGTGMSADTLAKAIEPFYTTKGIGQGTGLGLSMVHGLVGQLGGGMAIDSILGKGTIITLWLPLAKGSAAAAGDQVAAFKAPARSATVLLVDDEPLVRYAVADILRDAGYEVIEATSGAEAVRLVGEGLAPDILLTDQLMPGMKGTELAETLLALRRNLPVLIATGYSDVPGIPLPMISKPFTSAQLVERVRQLVEVDSPAH